MLINPLLTNEERESITPRDIFLDKKRRAVISVMAKENGLDEIEIIVKAFLDECRVPNIKENRKRKIMDELTYKFFDAAKHGSDTGVMSFIKAGFNVNAQHPVTKRTALHIGAAGEARDLINALVGVEGIDHLIRDSQGRLACELTDRSPEWVKRFGQGDMEMVKLLTRKAAEQAKSQGLRFRWREGKVVFDPLTPS